MKQQLKLCVAVFAILGFVCILFVYDRVEEETHRRPNRFSFRKYGQSNYIVFGRTHNSSVISIKEVLKRHQDTLGQEMEDYEFPQGTSLENFTMASGGQPLRNIIVATWRSGSTFLGDVINSVPGNFYHYEPLLDFGISQIRGPPYGEQAVKNLRNLLNCDYSDLDNYLDYGTTHTYLFSHNRRLWRECDIYPQYCWDTKFLNGFCKQFPFHSMKIVRIRLKLMEEILKDDKLNVKIILLIRDPRGVLQSRKHRDWCPGVDDCDRPDILCTDMASDYKAAVKFRKLYPDRFRVYRYEDISRELQSQLLELFEFFRLNFHPAVEEFLETHTKINIGGVSSTVRDSKNAPYHWKKDLIFSEVKWIQENCVEAMNLWGYVNAANESHLHNFNPVANYTAP